MGIKAKQIAGFETFSTSVINNLGVIEQIVDISSTSTLKEADFLNLAGWAAGTKKVGGVSIGSFLTPGQMNMCFAPYRVVNTTEAFMGMDIAANPLENQLIHGSSIAGMFKNCTKLKSITGINAPWAKAFSELFAGCTALEDVQQFPTNYATSMTSMFQGCTSLPAEFPWVIDVSSLSSGSDTADMFKGSSVRKVTFYVPTWRAELRETITKAMIDSTGQIEMIVFVDENGVQYVSNTFGNLNGTNWWSNGAVIADNNYLMATKASDFGTLAMYTITGVKNMFSGATKVTTVPNLILSEAITDADNMFANCVNLTSVPTLDLTHIETAHSMFINDRNITGTVNLAMPNVLVIGDVFSGCSKLTNLTMTTASAIADAAGAFNDCSGLKTIALPEGTTISGNIDNLFNNCSSLYQLSNVTLTNITSANNAFRRCSLLSSIPTFDTSALTELIGTFDGCGRVTDLSWVTTPNVTAFDRSFAGTNVASLAQVDVSRATTFHQVFTGCSRLATLPDLSKLRIKVQDWTRMFADCTALPAMFPYVLDMTSVTTKEDILDVIGGSCGSSEIKIAIENTGEIPSWVSTYYFGRNCLRIIVVDAADHSVVLGERTRANSEELYTETFTTAGTHWFTVPEGVNQVRVALVSGGEYTYDDTQSIADGARFTRRVCNVSSFGDITSLNSSIYADYFWNSWASIPFDKKSTGYALEWNATFSDQNKAGYGAGMWLASGGEKKNFVTMFVEPSLVDTLVNVTPGQLIRVVVGKGSVNSVGVNLSIAYVNQTPCHPQGYVMIGYGHNVLEDYAAHHAD